MKNNNLGMMKKSFSLYYNGGEIWAEHLDAIDNIGDMKRKFDEDLVQMARPSTSSYVAINLAESVVDKDFLQYIINAMNTCGKPYQRVVFIGLPYRLKRYLSTHTPSNLGVVACIDDFEKAKEWLI